MEDGILLSRHPPSSILYLRFSGRESSDESLNSVREHSHIAAAAVLKDDPFAGLFVDRVALSPGFGQVFHRGFVAVAEKNHRLVVRIGAFVVFVRRDADDLSLTQL